MLTIDTLRADHVGADGGRAGVTPSLDALGRAGAVFLDATAHVPLTLPSHISIFSGRYPIAHGVHDNGSVAVPESVPMLATVLHAAGYHTAAFVSSYVLRGSTGLARGFDVYDDRFEGSGRAHLTTTALERRGPEVAREAARWLAAAPRPFFLWVHFYDPHAPYDPPPAFAAKFPGHPYDAEIATSDFGVSMILSALPPDRRAETVIVATGDHGESLGEHGESEHGILLYDATLHVPLIMQGPGVPAGVRVRQQVRHVDLLPTVVALLGAQAPSPLDGVSLLPLLGSDQGRNGVRTASDQRENRGRPQSDSVARAATDAPISYAESRFGELHFGWSPIRSVRDGLWKYIDAPDAELYELTADPGERDNRRTARGETAAGMARVLGDLVARPETAPRTPAAAGADVADRLRSLGYVSGRVTIGAGRSGGARRSEGPGRSGGAGGSHASGGSGGEDPKQEIARYEKYVAAFNDGLGRLEAGRPRDAEPIFRRLAREFPLAFEAHQYLARALAGRRAWPEATAELDLAIRLSPREAVLYFDAARTHAEAAQIDRAFARVAEGRRLEPSSFYGATTEAVVARAAGDTDREERAWREAIRLNQTLAVGHLELGRLAEARGDRDAARTEYRLALDGDSTLAEARQALERVGR